MRVIDSVSEQRDALSLRFTIEPDDCFKLPHTALSASRS